MKKLTVILFISALIEACSAKTFAPTDQQLTAMQQKVPDITLKSVKEGYKHYSEKCASCHQLYHPGTYTSTQWDTILPKMFTKAKVSSEEQQTLIEDYVHALSK